MYAFIKNLCSCIKYFFSFITCFYKKIIGKSRNKTTVFFAKSEYYLLKTNKLTLPDKFFLLVDSVVILNDKLCVKNGDEVLRGQVLTFGFKNVAPIHSPTSGIVFGIIDNYISFLDKNFSVIIIDSDGKDLWIKRKFIHDYTRYNSYELIKLIYDFGVVGLGGSGFITSKKLQYSVGRVHTLVVNAVESEPYITSDDCLIQNFSQEIIQGCYILIWILKIKKVLIVLSEEKVISFNILKNITTYISNFKLLKVKNQYPIGSSKQLIKTLFNMEIPTGKHAIDLGIIMYNVGTVYAVKRAILNGEPLTERVVTLSGDKLSSSINVLARIGTSINYFVTSYGIDKRDLIVNIGGPITGSIIKNFNFSILKTSNCILFVSNVRNKLKSIEKNCIRCTLCSRSCPMNLLPEQLYWYSRYLNHNKSKEYNIQDCIECGICEQICPSNIPLVSYYRREKAQLSIIYLKSKKSKKFRNLFLFRQRRLRQLNKKKTDVIFSQYISDKKL